MSTYQRPIRDSIEATLAMLLDNNLRASSNACILFYSGVIDGSY